MHHAHDQHHLFHEGDGIIVFIREYLIGVTAAALLCGVVKTLLPGKGAVPTVTKMLLGLLMILAVVRPWTTISADGLSDWTQDFTADAQSVVSDAQAQVKETLRSRIKKETEAYILSKAHALGVQIEVCVEVSDETVAAPISVSITGAVSPYARQAISQMIADDLGINREAQEWIG